MRKLIPALTAILLLGTRLSAQDWTVPDDRKGRLSTFAFDDETRKTGQKLYTANCKSCHGIPGEDNWLRLVPPPGDPASEKFQKNSDGEMFYKVVTGRGQMPSFRTVLSANEIWALISYLRSYNQGYVQQVMQLITSSAYPDAEIRIALAWNSADSTVDISATAVSEKSSVAVTDAEMQLMVQRRFGHLAVDEPRNTDSRGFVRFRMPAGLPGDTAGNVLVMARFTDEETFGSAGKDTILRAGMPSFNESLVAPRAMWNTARKAPVWIILTYLGGVLIAWGFIMLVLLKLRDIFIIGENSTLNNK
ncbi:MAG: c-type cytochrome [Bacteroidales bacterium]|jgi:mono/diheme cytochrome c family protein|nr:c-type cytochrome [Bacteroidales bacterium]